MTNDRQIACRRPNRLAGYDYRQAGAYFITICTHRRYCILGSVIGGVFQPTVSGNLAAACWRALPSHYPNVALDAFVIMPNHVHGILMLTDRATERTPLSEIIRGYKTWSARSINRHRQQSGTPVWQRSYHDHIIRNETALDDIRAYIAANPLRWASDRENPAPTGSKPAAVSPMPEAAR